MTTTENARAALTRAAQPAEQTTIVQLIERQKPQIERALAGTLDAERFTRIVLTEIRRTPKLLDCNPESVLGALMLTAQLGLEPGPLGWAYLVPYGKECTFIVGYRGFLELAARSERIAGVTAEIVYEGDEWSGVRMSERGPRFGHVACDPEKRGERIGVYCSWLERLGPRVLVPKVKWLWPKDVAAARARSASARSQQSPWHTDEDAMWRKTAVRRAAPFMAMTPLLARAMETDERPVRWEREAVVIEAEEEVSEDENEATSDGGA